MGIVWNVEGRFVFTYRNCWKKRSLECGPALTGSLNELRPEENEQRFSSADEMREALENIVRTLDTDVPIAAQWTFSLYLDMSLSIFANRTRK